MAWYGARYVKETWLHGYLTSLLTGHTCHCPGCSRIHNSLLFETLNPPMFAGFQPHVTYHSGGFKGQSSGNPWIYQLFHWGSYKLSHPILSIWVSKLGTPKMPKKSAQTPENSTHLILSPMKSRSPHCTKANFSESSPTRCTARVQTDDSAQRRLFQTSGWATWLGCYRGRDSTDSTGSIEAWWNKPHKFGYKLFIYVYMHIIVYEYI